MLGNWAAWAGASAVVLVLLLSSAGLTASAHPAPKGSGTSETAVMHGFPGWMNINSVSLREQGRFHVELRMGAPLPAHPSLLGYGILDWVFGVSTNDSAAPAGWPFPKNVSIYPSEYMVVLWWDGTRYSAGVVDRTPLLSGGQATITPVPFQIYQNQIRFSVPTGLLGGSTNFSFFAVTEVYTAPDIAVNTATHQIVPVAVKPRIWGSEEFWQGGTPQWPSCGTSINGWFCAATWSRSVSGTSPVTVQGSPNWWDPVSATVSGDRTVRFQMTLAGALPRVPSLPGSKELFWVFCVDTNRTANPDGWPLPVGNPDECDYWVFLAAEGQRMAAAVSNSTPYLSGGKGTITAVPFVVIGSHFEILVAHSLLGNATTAGIVALTGSWSKPILAIHSATNVTRLAANTDFNPENFVGGPGCSYYGSNNGDCFTSWWA